MEELAEENQFQELALKEAFDHFDKFNLGYLPQETHPKLFSYLIVEKQFDESAIEKLLNVSIGNPRLTYREIVEAWRKDMIDEFSETPTQKLLKLLKYLKHKTLPEKPLQVQIDWAIEKIKAGKIYESELEIDPLSSSGECATATMNAIMDNLKKLVPWMRHYDRTQSHLSSSITTNLSITHIKSINSFDFNTFELIPILGRNNVLPLTAYCIFRENGLLDLIDENLFKNFLILIRNGYNQENPYHNDLHATDVLQMCHLFLNNGLKEIAQLDDIDCLAFLISALIHDFKHPGVTNEFLEATHSELAIIYNNHAILENYHIAESFRVIRNQCDLFKGFSSEQSAILRKRIISCVLGTDMSKHFVKINNLKNLLTTNNIDKGMNSEKIIDKKTSATEFESKQFIMDICLHAADIGSSGRVHSASEEWSQRIIEEFLRQGDLELKLGLPLSPSCNRRVSKLPEEQTGFINIFSGPILKALAQIFPKLEPLVQHIQTNEQNWRSLL